MEKFLNSLIFSHYSKLHFFRDFMDEVAKICQNISILEIYDLGKNYPLATWWFIWITSFQKLQKLVIDCQMDEDNLYPEELTNALKNVPLNELKEVSLKMEINGLFQVKLHWIIKLNIIFFMLS